MRPACSVMAPSSRSTDTPICRRSFAIVATSISAGTLPRRSGRDVSSDAHMIGSAAFLAPEIRISPSSGTRPRMRSLSTGAPLLRRQGAHGKRVDFLAHALAERRVDELMALHAAAPVELRRDDQRLEVLPVADDLDVLAGEPVLDALLDAFGGDHQCL